MKINNRLPFRWNKILLLFCIIYLFFLGSCKQINKSISIKYEIVKKDTCKYFCYEEKVMIINNTSDSIYFFKPDFRERNALGIHIPYFISPRKKEYNYFKKHENSIRDKFSPDYYLNDYHKNSNTVYNEMKKKEKIYFENSIFPIYLNDFRKINGFSKLNISDTQSIKFYIENDYQFIILLKPHENIYFYSNCDTLIKLNKKIKIFYKSIWYKSANTNKIFTDFFTKMKYHKIYPENMAGYKKMKGKMKSNKLVIKGDRIIKNKPVPKRFRVQ